MPDGIFYAPLRGIGATRFTFVRTDLLHGRLKGYIIRVSGDERAGGAPRRYLPAQLRSSRYVRSNAPSPPTSHHATVNKYML